MVKEGSINIEKGLTNIYHSKKKSLLKTLPKFDSKWWLHVLVLWAGSGKDIDEF